MPGFFGTCPNPITEKFSSSSTARKGNRANLIIQVLETTTSYFEPAVAIPTNLAQFLISGYLALLAISSIPEKLVNGGLSLGALGKLIITSMLLFSHVQCTRDSEDAVCDTGLYFQLCYAGLLIVVSALAENAKDKAATPAPAPLPGMEPGNADENENHEDLEQNHPAP